MFCQKCGVQNKEDANFCRACGESIATEGVQYSDHAENSVLVAIPKPKKNSDWFKKLLYIIAGTIACYYGLIFLVAIMVTANEEKACDSRSIERTLISAIDGSQFARLEELSVERVTNVQDTGSIDDNLSCSADITFNNAEEVRFEYTVTPTDDDKYWLEASRAEKY